MLCPEGPLVAVLQSHPLPRGRERGPPTGASTQGTVNHQAMLRVHGPPPEGGRRPPRSSQAAGAARGLCRGPDGLERQKATWTSPRAQAQACSTAPALLPAPWLPRPGARPRSHPRPAPGALRPEFALSFCSARDPESGCSRGLGPRSSPAKHPGGQPAHLTRSWLRDHPPLCAQCGLTVLQGKGLAGVGASPNGWVSPQGLCWAVRMSPFVT